MVKGRERFITQPRTCHEKRQRNTSVCLQSFSRCRHALAFNKKRIMTIIIYFIFINNNNKRYA
jgi:hypothetical protein